MPPAAGRTRQVNGRRFPILTDPIDTYPIPAEPPEHVQVDDAVVRQLHERAAELLAAEFRAAPDVGRLMTGGRSARTSPPRWSAHTSMPARRAGERDVGDEDEQALLDAVLAYLFGLGRLQAITDDPDVENVMVLGYDRVRVEYADGRVEDGPRAADNNRELLQMIQRIAAIGQRNERALTTAKPTLNMRLPNGNRLAAMHVVTPVPVVVTRRHRTKKVNLDDMVDDGRDRPDPAPVPRRARPRQPQRHHRRPTQLREDHADAGDGHRDPPRRVVRHHGDRVRAGAARDRRVRLGRPHRGPRGPRRPRPGRAPGR